MSRYDNFLNPKKIQRRDLGELITPDSAYLYGILIGDGNITPIFNKNRGHRTHLIQLVSKDRTFCESFLNTANSILGTKSRSIHKRKDSYWRASITSNALAKWFFTVKPKELVLTFPIEFLRGFYESEGGVFCNDVCLCNTEKWKLGLADIATKKIGFPMNWTEQNIKNNKIMYRLRKNTPKFKSNFIMAINPIIKRGNL